MEEKKKEKKKKNEMPKIHSNHQQRQQQRQQRQQQHFLHALTLTIVLGPLVFCFFFFHNANLPVETMWRDQDQVHNDIIFLTNE